jgi:hypothetical protein
MTSSRIKSASEHGVAAPQGTICRSGGALKLRVRLAIGGRVISLASQSIL